MLSILIPIYNWDSIDLVKRLHDQCSQAKIDFEILALDDFSPNRDLIAPLKNVDLPYFRLLSLEENVGNAEARNILARTAQFNWLLFLDADMIPAHPNFIELYLKEIQLADFDIMSGGIIYQEKVDPKFKLKWLHGKGTEEQIQNKDPYLEIRGNNFLIQKPVFLRNPLGGLPENYGYVDTHFGLKLKQAGARVKIIHNPCIHLGLETNERFIEKYKTALRNAFWMMNNQPEMADNLRIIQMYKKLKKWGLIQQMALFFAFTEKGMLKNLLSKNPSLFVFQLYKLGYISTLKIE